MTTRITRSLKTFHTPVRRKSPRTGAFPKAFKPKAPRILEKTIQKNCLRYMELQWPRVLVFHVPNGGSRGGKVVSKNGKTFSLEALEFKRMGVKKGIPDLIIAAMRGGYGGLYTELKTEDGVVNEDQKKVMEHLRDEGYYVAICRSLEEFQAVVDAYLSGKLRRTG